MNFKLSVGSAALALAILAGGTLAAQTPANNVSASAHPNLAAAQRLVTQAFQKLTAAQRANHMDMKGHAAKAKQLLIQANQEIKLAAEIANQNHK